MSTSNRKQSMTACILCCHEIDNITRFDTVGVCGHTGCCSRCSLRMRQLLGTTSCVICKTDLPRVICIEHASDKFDSFQDWGDNIGPSHVFDDASGMFILARDFPNLHKLRDPVCTKCGKSFATLAALKTHLLDVHQLQFCSICLEHKKVFLNEQLTFSKESLKRHNTKGAPREGFTGHPRCDFCFSRHYSTAELYDHLHKNHFECDICLHSLHIQNRYYKNYPDLENHFRAEHYLCEETSCLERKFVVFKTHFDLQAHFHTEHPHLKTSRKIDVHFTVRRAIHDDESNNSSDYDATQFERPSNTSRNIINVADFPSLSSDVASTTHSTFWESSQGLSNRQPRREDFPALGGGSNATGSSSGTGSSFRNALAPPPTPAMQAHMNNSADQWAYPELASAALGANNPLLRFVKPSRMKPTKRGGGAKQQLEEKAAAPLGDDEDDEDDEATESQSKSALVLQIRQMLGSDAKYEVFRENCRAFRTGEVAVATFYATLCDMFSPAQFKYVVQLVRLLPDASQVELFLQHHHQLKRQQRAGATANATFTDAQTKKQHKKQLKQRQSTAPAVPGASPMRRQQPQMPATASAGWTNALRETNAAGLGPKGKGPTVVIHNTNTRALLGRDDPPPTTWRSKHTWQQTPEVPSAPFAQLAVTASASAPVAPAAAASYATPTTKNPPMLKSRQDFPGLPTAGRPVGVQAVTRATWDDTNHAIASNRVGGDNARQANGTGSGKKKQKKKSMTLGEMAMKFA